MKLFNTIAKLTAAIAAVAGIAFLVYKYMDAIKAWIAKLCPCCAEEVELEEDFVPEEEIAAEAEEPVEEVVAEEPAEEAPAEEAPVAEEADFEA